MPDFDVVIIGAGIAGASIAAEIAPFSRVLIVETEDRPGYHSTGRSAAFWTESYGGPLVQPLTTASGPWLASPPSTFSDRGFLSERGALTVAREQDLPALHAFRAEFAGTDVAMIQQGRAELMARIPALDAAYIHGIYEPDCRDIDVAGLHQAYLASARRAGATIRLKAGLQKARRVEGVWQLDIAGQQVTARHIVNAAGAWADDVAQMAGIARLGIQPYRRTILQLRVDPPAPADLPLVLGINGDFYFKPEAGRLWLSPHDETPVAAGDVAPEELDVALAIDRFENVVDWKIEAVEQKWAGLRSFAPDRLPVIGWSGDDDGFFWFAGQGGYGIQTAPAAAKLAAALLLSRPRDPMVADINASLYDPNRF
jgi:D-arginine dehydrogenase